MQADVVIIGGGLAGLACAVALCDDGLDVMVLEREPILGGRARSWVDADTGDTVDIGPHILLTGYPNMLALLGRLGTRERIVWQTEKFITYADRKPVVMRTHRLPAPLHFVPGLFAMPVSLKDLASNNSVVWLAMKMSEQDVLRLDAQAADEFLRSHGVTPRLMEWFWASTSMAILNVPLEKCSAGALMRFFRQLVGRNDYYIGMPGIGLGDLYVPPAVRLIEASGGRVLLNREVAGFTGTDDAVTGVVLADGTRVETRCCVSAIPPPDLRRIALPAWVQRHAAFRDLSHFEPDPYISSYLWFDRKLTHEKFWMRVWSPVNLNYDFYDLSNIRPGWTECPSVIASNIMYSHRADHMTDDEIVEATVRELAEFIPEAARARITHARVHRIPMAITCPYPGTEQRRPETRAPIRGLMLAGDWTRTHLPSSMEGSVRSGWLAAEQVLTDLGRPRRIALPVLETEGFAGLVRRAYRAFPGRRVPRLGQRQP